MMRRPFVSRDRSLNRAGRFSVAGGMAGALVLVSGLLIGQSCVPIPDPVGDGTYANTTDPTNRGATYVGSAACSACHPNVAQFHQIHGHAHILQPVQGGPPAYPAENAAAGVPNPPAGFAWNDIAFVIGGYMRKANFVNAQGYVLTNATTGVNTQWNLQHLGNQEPARFVAFEPDGVLKPYDTSCFSCHTTGPSPTGRQGNRQGVVGTWAEAGVQCEACHGPGSNHVPNPQRRDLYVNSTAEGCGTCHSRTGTGERPAILASNGFILNYQQYGELQVSGGHSGFACTTCHDPHVSTTSQRDLSLRNRCTSCHGDMNMALHQGVTFVRGDYVERVSCESCHMPLATVSASAKTETTPRGVLSRTGDLRTHIFRINTAATDFRGMLTADLTAVSTDANGAAAVTVDFVCLRCHNGLGNAFDLTVLSASDVARQIHNVPQRVR